MFRKKSFPPVHIPHRANQIEPAHTVVKRQDITTSGIYFLQGNYWIEVYHHENLGIRVPNYARVTAFPQRKLLLQLDCPVELNPFDYLEDPVGCLSAFPGPLHEKKQGERIPAPEEKGIYQVGIFQDSQTATKAFSMLLRACLSGKLSFGPVWETGLEAKVECENL